ncbi:PaaI family thioesterase [Pyruvatibacter mobilis]|uniref:PaaI family thioesterase n=1 Tax=Pyruvatibacter mobilis TaxID=1712261 RepID=UPI003BB12A96
MNLAEMSGLDLMRLGVSLPGNMGDQGIASVIPMNIIEADEGRVVFLATADARHTNPLGSVHGGFAATVLDSATGCAVHTLLPAGVGFGTVDLNVKMIRPVPFEQQMRAVGEVIDRTRSLAISEATLTDMDGKIFAHASATCRIITPS